VLRFAPCQLDFDTSLSLITTVSQSPLPSRPHSWLPPTNPPYFSLASLHFLQIWQQMAISTPSNTFSSSSISCITESLYTFQWEIRRHMSPLKCPFPSMIRAPDKRTVLWAHASLTHKLHLDRFNRFRRAHRCKQHAGRHTYTQTTLRRL